MEIIIISIMLLSLLLVSFIAVRVHTSAPHREELSRLRGVEVEYQRLQVHADASVQEIQQLYADKARLEANLEHATIAASEKMALLEKSEIRLKTEFENLAHKIFEDKGKVLTEQSKERLSSILDPLKEQLHSFRKRVDEVHKDDTEKSASLMEQVKQLQHLSNQVSDDANNLAKAISGDSKAQGNWGELIIERIFESSGLEKGREYESQVSMRDEDGRVQRPDFIISLPGQKAVVVDSKVSLTAYERFSSAETEEARNQAIKDHLASVRSHVKSLQEKQYGAGLGNRTLDFVIMCIPIEPAFQAALKNDQNLVYDLANGNVVITGPTTLMITLKLIAQGWRREKENRNAEVIADKAGKMYDQVARVAESMVQAQSRLKTTTDSFDIALKRLSTGQGNLVTRVEELRTLGAKVKKQMPEGVQELN